VVCKTTNLKVEILNVTPQTSTLLPQEIVALSALLSFKGKSIKTLFREIKKEQKDLKKTVQAILLKSALRGHASMATTPVLTISFQGSKFLDSLLTGLVFSSSLMASGRRTGASFDDIVYPEAIYQNKKAKRLYKEVSQKNIEFFNHLIDRGVRKDEASKILQYGLVGTGIISLSLESLISFKREYENEKDWMPQEAGIFLKAVESKLSKLGLDWLWSTRQVAPRNVYPYPNIFKNPQKTNLVRELRKKYASFAQTKILNFRAQLTPNLKKELKEVLKEKDWQKRLLALRKLVRDYHLVLSFETLSSVPWRVWGEKKRHRTVPMVVDSIYHAIEKGVFSLPPTVAKNKKLRLTWQERVQDSLDCYWQLVEWGINPSDAIFVIPRALHLDVLQHFDLYNLLLGYYPLRLCSTAEEEMLRLTEDEVSQLKKILRKKKLFWLARYVVPKCYFIGFCPEKEFCGKILKVVKNYCLKTHQKRQEELEKKFQTIL